MDIVEACEVTCFFLIYDGKLEFELKFEVTVLYAGVFLVLVILFSYNGISIDCMLISFSFVHDSEESLSMIIEPLLICESVHAGCLIEYSGCY